jgi:hypothetical protein
VAVTPEDKFSAKYRKRKAGVDFYQYKENHSFHNVTVLVFLFLFLMALAWALFG